MRGGWRHQEARSRYRRRILRIGLAVTALVALAWFAYHTGLREGDAPIDGLESRITDLEAEKRAASHAAEEAQAALRGAVRDAGMWRQRYEDEVPRGPTAGLWKLVKRKLDEGVEQERLIDVIELATNERQCDAQMTTKRIIVKTHLHGGSDTAAGFGQGRITVLGDGQSARDADRNPHAWYDPILPVTISFVTIGGDTEKVEGYLPLHHAVLVGKDEFRFTITEGTRNFASVTAQRCDYP